MSLPPAVTKATKVPEGWRDYMTPNLGPMVQVARTRQAWEELAPSSFVGCSPF